MKILIIEDDAHKRDEFSSFLQVLGVPSDSVLIAKDMAEFLGKFDPKVSLCIVDLRLPAYEGGTEDHNGIGILQALDQKGAGHAKLLAISAYPEEFANIRPQFESRGCMLLDFEQKAVWQSVLKQMVLEVQSAEQMATFCNARLWRCPVDDWKRGDLGRRAMHLARAVDPSGLNGLSPPRLGTTGGGRRVEDTVATTR